MRSLPQALLWETLTNGRWILPAFFLLGLLFPILVYGSLSAIHLDTHSREFIILQVAFIMIVMFKFAMGVVLSMRSFSRLYLLPISTHSIVAWHMFAGAILLAAGTSGIAWILNGMFHVEWPILGIALFAFAVWSTFLAVMSVSTLQSIPGIFAAGLPGLVLVFWFQSRFGPLFSSPQHVWTSITPGEALVLGTFFTVGYGVTLYGVQVARCGERLPTLGFWSWVGRKWEAISLSWSERTPFRSPMEAHIWNEWRTKGFALPFATLCLMSLMGFGAAVDWGLRGKPHTEIYESVFVMGGVLTLLAGFAGAFLGLDIFSHAAGQSETQLGEGFSAHASMGSFLTSRPFGNEQFAKSILFVAGKSIALAFLAWLPLPLICLLASWFTNERITVLLPKGIGALYLPLLVIGSWAAMTNMATVSLLGRGAKVYVILVSTVVGFFVLIGVLEQFVSSSVSNQFQKLCMVILTVILIAFTIALFRLAKRYRYISWKGLSLTAIGGSALLAILIALLPEGRDWVSYPMTLSLVCLAVLPFASTSLAIHFNRHR